MNALLSRLVGFGYTGTTDIRDNGTTCLEDWDGDGVFTPTDYDDADPLVWLEPDTYVGNVASGLLGFCTGYSERHIEGNLDLSSASQAGVEALDCVVGVTGYLSINHNGALRNVDGLANLTTLGGNLYLGNNTVVADVNGLANLTSIGGYIYIEHNALTDLDGFGSLGSVGSLLYIGDNAALTDVDGLASLVSVGGYFTIANNHALCLSSVSMVLAQLMGHGYAGTVNTYGNDTGC